MSPDGTARALDPVNAGFAAVRSAGSLLLCSSVEVPIERGAGDDTGDVSGAVRDAGDRGVDVLTRRLEQESSPAHIVRLEHAVHAPLAAAAVDPSRALRDADPSVAVRHAFRASLPGGFGVSTTAIAGDAPVCELTPNETAPTTTAAVIGHVGPFIFVRGSSGGQGDVANQIVVAYRSVEEALGAAGASREDLVRVDACLADIDEAMHHRDVRTRHFDGRMNLASTVVGTPHTGSLLELNAIAVRPGTAKDVAYYEGRADLARTVAAGGLVFASGVLGNRGRDGKLREDLAGQLEPQTELAMQRLELSLADFDADVDAIVRLDVYLQDASAASHALGTLRSYFGDSSPAVTVVGATLEATAAIELTAIAIAPGDPRR